MKKLMTTLALGAMPFAAPAQTTTQDRLRVAPEAAYRIAPPMADYTDMVLFGDVWIDPALSPRDRSLVTVSALIASGRTAVVGSHTRRALDNGVTPEEVAEIIAHLAFYTGWPNAVATLAEVDRVYAERGITSVEIPAADPLAHEPAAEAARAATVAQNVAPVAPGLASDTDEVLFADLWLRPGLAPRDRSLITVSALIAMGQAEQLGFHLNRALDNGLTEAEAGEVLRHVAYYVGWPRAMSGVQAVRATIEARNDAPAPVSDADVGVIRGAEAEKVAGPAARFAGAVEVGPLFQTEDPARLGGGLVSFDAGARTAWHTHPLGQTLYVTEGCILVQSEGHPVQVAGPGDIVQIPPHVRHWHGAAQDQAGKHFAISEALNGTTVTWLELVSDEDYAQAVASCTQGN